MATGRTVQKFIRIYTGHEGPGYPSLLCGLTRSVGPLTWAFDEIDATTICDEVKGALPGQPNISPGTINVVMDGTAPTTKTAHMFPATFGFTIGLPLITQIAIGIRAAPILGDPVFGGIFPFLGMTEVDDGGLITASFNLGSSGDASDLMPFPKPWGQLLHPYGAETGANTSAGADGVAASANGGLMLLHIFESDSNAATINVQHADTNVDGSFSDLTGATITFSGGAGYSYYATVAAGTAVKQFLRWQSTVDTNTFVMSFIRG